GTTAAATSRRRRPDPAHRCRRTAPPRARSRPRPPATGSCAAPRAATLTAREAEISSQLGSTKGAATASGEADREAKIAAHGGRAAQNDADQASRLTDAYHAAPRSNATIPFLSRTRFGGARGTRVLPSWASGRLHRRQADAHTGRRGGAEDQGPAVSLSPSQSDSPFPVTYATGPAWFRLRPALSPIARCGSAGGPLSRPY